MFREERIDAEGGRIDLDARLARVGHDVARQYVLGLAIPALWISRGNPTDTRLTI